MIVRPRSAPVLLLLGLGLGLPRPVPAAQPAPLPEATADAAEELLGALNAARAELGLPALRLDPRLGRAAQRHADDMVERGYYDLRSPEGETIDDWVEETGYPAGLITEKVTQSWLAPRAMVAEWAMSPRSGRGSVFHPEVTELGVGRAVPRDRPVYPIYALVLARPREEPVAEGARPSGLQDLEETRRRMTASINRVRKEEGRAPLRRQPLLDRIAQERAERVAAERAGEGGSTGLEPLYAGLLADLRTAGYRASATRGVSAVALSSSLPGLDALEVRLAEPEGRLSFADPVPTEIGIGGAAAGPDGGEVLWVLLLARPSA